MFCFDITGKDFWYVQAKRGKTLKPFAWSRESGSAIQNDEEQAGAGVLERNCLSGASLYLSFVNR